MIGHINNDTTRDKASNMIDLAINPGPVTRPPINRLHISVYGNTWLRGFTFTMQPSSLRRRRIKNAKRISKWQSAIELKEDNKLPYFLTIAI